MPFRPTFAGELAALLVMLSPALLAVAPSVVGENVTRTAVLLPAVSDFGNVIPKKLNGPETVMALIVRLVEPVLVSTTDCGGLVLPTAT